VKEDKDDSDDDGGGTRSGEEIEIERGNVNHFF